MSRRVFKVGGVRVKDAALLALKGEDEARNQGMQGSLEAEKGKKMKFCPRAARKNHLVASLAAATADF